jgi:hypothetical protein
MFEQEVQHPGHSTFADIVVTSKLDAMCAAMHQPMSMCRSFPNAWRDHHDDKTSGRRVPALKTNR